LAPVMVDGIAQKPLGDQQPTKTWPFFLWMHGVQVPPVHFSGRSAVALGQRLIIPSTFATNLSRSNGLVMTSMPSSMRPLPTAAFSA
jgi:hypothetical protein